MYIYNSTDGLNFNLVKGPAYVCPFSTLSLLFFRTNTAQTPTTGLIRDPSIIRHTDGYYYVSYTTNWEGRDFAIARSSNLLDWTLHTTVSISDTAQARTWAPEIFQDPRTGKTNIIVSLGESLTTFNPYLYTATDATLTSWTGPVAMSGIGPNYIDTFVVWDEESGMYHAYTKNETSKYLEHAVAYNLAGPWTFVQTGTYASPRNTPSVLTHLQATLQGSDEQRAHVSQHWRMANIGCLQMDTTVASTSTATVQTCIRGAHTRRYLVAYRALSGTALSGTWASFVLQWSGLGNGNFGYCNVCYEILLYVAHRHEKKGKGEFMESYIYKYQLVMGKKKKKGIAT